MTSVTIYDPSDFDGNPLTWWDLEPYLRNKRFLRRHPDSSRQQTAKRRAVDYRAARRLNRDKYICRKVNPEPPLGRWEAGHRVFSPKEMHILRSIRFKTDMFGRNT